ncbi:MAG: hypothetical protein ACOCUI_05810, partial [bacterium]
VYLIRDILPLFREKQIGKWSIVGIYVNKGDCEDDFINKDFDYWPNSWNVENKSYRLRQTLSIMNKEYVDHMYNLFKDDKGLWDNYFYRVHLAGDCGLFDIIKGDFGFIGNPIIGPHGLDMVPEHKIKKIKEDIKKENIYYIHGKLGFNEMVKNNPIEKKCFVIYSYDSNLEYFKNAYKSIKENCKYYDVFTVMLCGEDISRLTIKQEKIEEFCQENNINYFYFNNQDFLTADNNNIQETVGKISISKFFYDQGYKDVYIIPDTTLILNDVSDIFEKYKKDKWMFICPFVDRTNYYEKKQNSKLEQIPYEEWPNSQEVEKTPYRLRQSIILYNREFIFDLYEKYKNEENIYKEIFSDKISFSDCNLFDFVKKDLLGYRGVPIFEKIGFDEENKYCKQIKNIIKSKNKNIYFIHGKKMIEEICDKEFNKIEKVEINENLDFSKKYRILFPERHFDQLMDYANLCIDSDIDLYIPQKESDLFGSASGAESILEWWNGKIKIIESYEQIEYMSKRNFFDFVIVSEPDQIFFYNQFLKENFKIKPKLIYNIGAANEYYFDSIRNSEVDSVMWCSQRIINELKLNNSFLMRKIPSIDRNRYKLTENKNGFYSYINKYGEFFKKGFDKFINLKEILKDVEIINYGLNTEGGFVNDLAKMTGSKGTIHLKDYGAICNAVSKSMAIGLPVFMDKDTYINGYYDSINGIHVYNNIEDMASEIREVETSEEKLKEFFDFANDNIYQFRTDKEYTERFVNFLNYVKYGNVKKTKQTISIKQNLTR